MISKPFLISVLVMLAAVAAGWIVGNNGVRAGLILLAVIVTVPLTIAVLVKPHIGLYITILLLPFDRFYEGAAFLSLVGFITLLSHLAHTRLSIKSRVGWTPIYALAIGFLIWMFVTDPESAIRGRNWVFTYFQLIVLMWLTVELMTPKRQVIFMFLYVVGCAIPATAALNQGELAASIFSTIRAEGFVENANVFAMYLLMAIPIAFYFLVSSGIRLIVRAVVLGALVLCILGLVFSVSRTGSIALGVILAASFFLYPKLAAARTRGEGIRNTAYIIILVAVMVGAAARLIPPQYWSIIQEAQKQIEEGSSARRGTLVQRLDLWTLAIADFEQSPIVGNGVNSFVERHGGSVVHNMYLTILAEHGLIGAFLFLGWIVVAIVNLLRVILWSPRKDEAALAATWLLVMIGTLFMCITASFQYYKIHWFVAGLSMTFYLPPLGRKSRSQPAPPEAPAELSPLNQPIGQTS